MKYRIEYLPQAIEDLQAIEDWYRLNFDDRTALRVSNSIVDTILRLEEFPISNCRTTRSYLYARNEYSVYSSYCGYAHGI